jgi:hypothetical protein
VRDEVKKTSFSFRKKKRKGRGSCKKKKEDRCQAFATTVSARVDEGAYHLNIRFKSMSKKVDGT